MAFLSFGIGGWALIATLGFHAAIPGWASTVIPMYFLGGIQLLGVGIIGEYISKIYLETKQRPRFIIEKTTGPFEKRLYAPDIGLLRLPAETLQ
jgi:glycosyltransferase involved in cell wall biosynthesis